MRRGIFGPMIELPDTLRDLVTRERGVITDLLVLLGKLDADARSVSDVRTAVDDLDGLFLLVVAGEFNAGKSSLVNALLGERVMPEGVTPTTDRVTFITYGEEITEVDDGPNVVRRTYPNPILDAVAFVDTPGTNAIVAKHQELSERFVPRADLVLFVTSADRPFTESERVFLELIASWGKKVVMVVNKIDILTDPSEQDKVIEYVRENARKVLGVKSEVFGVSARQALKARLEHDEVAYAASGIKPLEDVIAERLGSERLKLKLSTPLGVANHTSTAYTEVITSRLALLEGDDTTLSEIERQRKQFDRDMKRDLNLHLARLKGVLQEVERRGEEFFEDTIRLRRVVKLMNTEKVRDEFKAQVVGASQNDIDNALHELVDWFIQRNLQLWEDVMKYINERRDAEQQGVIGEVGGRFQYDRQALLTSLRDRTESALESYDPKTEATRLADSLQSAVVQTGLLEVGGLGLGAGLIALLSGAAFDITGLAVGLSVMGLGLLVLPRQRAKAKRELRKKLVEMQGLLDDSIGKQFELELARSQEKLTGAISPYTRFVGAELDHLTELKEELEKVSDRITSLRREVEALP